MTEAHELQDIAAWVSDGPHTLGARDDVVVLDFWTYSSARCLRNTLPLQTLWYTYDDHGVRVIGVHAPQFPFEHDEEHVRQAVDRHRIPYPVALDNDHTTWDAYGNHHWPRQAVIGPDGDIQHEHIGAHGHAGIEGAIRALLNEQGKDLPDPVYDPPHEGPDDAQDMLTPELYTGERYGALIGNRQSVVPHAAVTFDIPNRRALNMLYLDGDWRQESEYLVAETDGTVSTRFIGRDAYLVAGPGDHDTREATIRLDDEPVPGERAGDAVEDGAVTVDMPDCYHVVDTERLGMHEVMVEVEAGTRVYVLSFL